MQRVDSHEKSCKKNVGMRKWRSLTLKCDKMNLLRIVYYTLLNTANWEAGDGV